MMRMVQLAHNLDIDDIKNPNLICEMEPGRTFHEVTDLTSNPRIKEQQKYTTPA